jgi:hypothetical protein
LGVQPGSAFVKRADLWAGLRHGVLLGAAAAVTILPPAGLATAPHHSASGHGARSPAAALTADFRGHLASVDARLVAYWVARSQDNHHLPFAILDKRDARVYVFDAGARLIDSSPVLLGAAPGDDSVVGIGKRPMAQVLPKERTTPAGRFVSQPGRNASGEDVIWVDYDAAVSMHRVRPVDPKERRLERLASNDPAQRRISYGCINVPVAFFNGVLKPVLGTQRAVVYVLPETRPVGATFASVRTGAARMGTM